jgi:hypothetical protein
VRNDYYLQAEPLADFGKHGRGFRHHILAQHFHGFVHDKRVSAPRSAQTPHGYAQGERGYVYSPASAGVRWSIGLAVALEENIGFRPVAALHEFQAERIGVVEHSSERKADYFADVIFEFALRLLCYCLNDNAGLFTVNGVLLEADDTVASRPAVGSELLALPLQIFELIS